MSTPNVGYHQLTPLEFLERAARVRPNAEAVIYGQRRMNYAQLGEYTQKFAKALTRFVKPGQTVTVVASNIPEMLVAHYAVPLMGGVLSALNPRLTSREFTYILEHSESRVVLVDSEQAQLVQQAVEKLSNPPEVFQIPDEEFGVVATGEISTIQDLVDSAPEMDDFAWEVADENQTITLNYTSGTTGPPKGVLYTHRGAALAAQSNAIHLEYAFGMRYLWTLPMFHCNGWTNPWAVTSVAGTHVCLRAVRQDALWDAFDDIGITHMCGAPVVCATILESERAHTMEPGPILATAGAAPPPSIISGLEEIGVRPVHVYGLTETYGPVTICEIQPEWKDLSVKERSQKMARQGVAMMHAGEVTVLDMDGNQVPADGETTGEVVMRGNGVMKEYYKNPEATADAFAGGWYHSGDLGVLYPDGYIKLVDRLKDIIISGGENISSIEVEGVLHSHPKVQDVAVIGEPHEKWGERPVAYVVVSGEVSQDELREFCQESLAGFKVPDRFEIIDAMPRTATGKIRKNELRS